MCYEWNDRRLDGRVSVVVLYEPYLYTVDLWTITHPHERKSPGLKWALPQGLNGLSISVSLADSKSSSAFYPLATKCSCTCSLAFGMISARLCVCTHWVYALCRRWMMRAPPRTPPQYIAFQVHITQYLQTLVRIFNYRASQAPRCLHRGKWGVWHFLSRRESLRFG